MEDKSSSQEFREKISEQGVKVAQIKKPSRRRKITAIGVIVIVIVAAGWAVFRQLGMLDAIFARQITAKVIDTQFGEGIENAKIVYDQQSALTDSNGEARLNLLLYQNYQFSISKAGYQTLAVDKKISRGEALNFSLQSEQERVKVKVIIRDFFTDELIKDASFKINNDKHSVPNGDDTLIIPVGDFVVQVSAAGYIDKEQTISTTTDTKEIQFEMVDAGTIVFVSNRDNGKRNIYSCNFDGTDQKALFERIGETEYYNVQVGPNKKKMVFLTNKDSVKDRYGNYRFYPYISSLEGLNLQKISSAYSTYYLQWSPLGGYVYYRGYEKENYGDGRVYIYDVIAGREIGYVLTNSPVFFSQDESKIAYAVYENRKYKVNVADPNNSNVQTIFEQETGTSGYASVIKFFNANEIVYSWNNYKDAVKYVRYNISSAEKTEIDNPFLGQREGVLSPQKDKIAYVANRDGKRDVYIAGKNGDNEEKITSLGTVSYGWIQWSSDGKRIFFNSSKEAETARYGVSIQAKMAKKIVDITGEGYYCGEGGCGGGGE